MKKLLFAFALILGTSFTILSIAQVTDEEGDYDDRGDRIRGCVKTSVSHWACNSTAGCWNEIGDAC